MRLQCRTSKCSVRGKRNTTGRLRELLLANGRTSLRGRIWAEIISQIPTKRSDGDCGYGCLSAAAGAAPRHTARRASCCAATVDVTATKFEKFTWAFLAPNPSVADWSLSRGHLGVEISHNFSQNFRKKNYISLLLYNNLTRPAADAQHVKSYQIKVKWRKAGLSYLNQQSFKSYVNTNRPKLQSNQTYSTICACQKYYNSLQVSLSLDFLIYCPILH